MLLRGFTPVLSLEQRLLTFGAKCGKGKTFLVPMSLAVDNTRRI
jgi:hypothetical protein